MAEGLVVSQVPRAGTIVAAGTPIDFIVSSGPEPTLSTDGGPDGDAAAGPDLDAGGGPDRGRLSLPPVLGRPVAARGRRVHARDGHAPPGFDTTWPVGGQSPDPGSKETPGSRIDLDVFDPASLPTCPPIGAAPSPSDELELRDPNVWIERQGSPSSVVTLANSVRTQPKSQLHSAPWRTGVVRTAARPNRRRPGAGSVRVPRRAARPARTSGGASPAFSASAVPIRASPRSEQTRSGPVGKNGASWCRRAMSAAPNCSRWRLAAVDRRAFDGVVRQAGS